MNDQAFTPEEMRRYMKQAAKIVMPWSGTGSSPVTYERKTGDGRFVGKVDPWLGGYGNPSQPRHHGWGYKGINPQGQGVCTSGIVKVEPLVGHPSDPEDMSEEQWKEAEIAARDEAMKIVEEFLAKEFPNLTILHDELP